MSGTKVRIGFLACCLLLCVTALTVKAETLTVDSATHVNPQDIYGAAAQITLGSGTHTLTLTQQAASVWIKNGPPMLEYAIDGQYYAMRMNSVGDSVTFSTSSGVTVYSYFTDTGPGDNYGQSIITITPGGATLSVDPEVHVDTWYPGPPGGAEASVPSGDEYRITLIEKSWENTSPPMVIFGNADGHFAARFNNVGDSMIADFRQGTGDRSVVAYFTDTSPGDNSGRAVFHIAPASATTPAGFVTGGGWIDSPSGAYADDPSLTGKANFGFVAKYMSGADAPSGQTQFRFKAGDLNFRSTEYQWLVVDGPQAKFKGSGTINGEGDYDFMLAANDDSPDTFRIKIWDRATEDVVYDNQMGESDDSDAATEIGGGSIVIHKAK